MYNESQKVPKVKHSFRMPKTTVFLNSQNSKEEQLSGADHQVSQRVLSKDELSQRKNIDKMQTEKSKDKTTIS